MLTQESKQKLESVLTRSAELLTEALDSSGKLVKENAKEVVTEVIVFEGYVTNSINLASNFVFGIGLAFLFSYVFGQPVGGYEDPAFFSQGGKVFTLMVIGALVLMCGVCAVSCVVDILKAKYAPRLFIIEYAHNMLKSDSSEKSK